MNEFLSQLAQRAPQIALAFLAANRGGPQAAAAFQGGLLEAHQRDQALARQARLDEEQRQLRATQEAHLQTSDALAQRHADLQSQQADFQRRQAAVNTLHQAIQQQGETASDPAAAENALLGQATGLESFYDVPSGSLSPMIPSMTQPVNRGVRQDARSMWAEAEGRLLKKNKDADVSDSTVSFDWSSVPVRLQRHLVAQGHPEGQPVKPSQIQAVAGAPTITAPPKAIPDKRGFATKDITINGKRMLAGFDPDTNQYFAPGDVKTPLVGDIQEYNRPQPQVPGMDTGGPEDIANAIIRGDQPPTTTGLYRYGAAVRAILAKKGFNLAQAESDWKATQKHLSTLNSSQQVRMHQAIDNASHSLDVIDDLANQWNGSRLPLLNKAQLAAAKQGVLGEKAQQIATQLEAQIADVTSELANVYMGGNSPTDHAMMLAAKNLQANWSLSQLKSAIDLSRKNLKIRSNSMRNVGVAGASAGNLYATPSPAPAGAGTAPPPKNPYR